MHYRKLFSQGMTQAPLSLKKFHDGPSRAFSRLKISQIAGQTETLNQYLTTLDMYHFHLPLPKDESFYNKTSLTEVTESDLAELRRFPCGSVVQKLLHFVYFTVFGVVKLVSTLLFALLAVRCSLLRSSSRDARSGGWLGARNGAAASAADCGR
jgi:hypothetical protein